MADSLSTKKLSGSIFLQSKKKNTKHEIFSFVNFRFADTFLTVLFLIFFPKNTTSYANSQPNYISQSQTSIVTSEIPKKLTIGKIGVTLDVKPADISNDTWELFEKEASFGRGTAPLNSETGNTAIFAHAKSGLFAKLSELEIGDVINIESSKSAYLYVVSEKLYVKPTDTSFIYKEYGKSLMLFTCYGENDEKRVLIVAKQVTKGSND